MAASKRAAGIALNKVDREALGKFPDPPSSFERPERHLRSV